MREYRNLILCGFLYTAFAGLMVACFYLGCLLSVATNWLPATYGPEAGPAARKPLGFNRLRNFLVFWTKKISRSLWVSTASVEKKVENDFSGVFVPQRVKKSFFFFSLRLKYLRLWKVIEKDFACDFLKTCHNGNHRQSRKTLTQKPKKIMSDIRKEISILREILEDSILTPAERQSIWAQIAHLEALAS